MKYVYSKSTDPYWNLALEQYLFDSGDESYFMLWQNDNAIIIGKNQNTSMEINEDFVKDNDIKVVRRLSGGGAVYHDLGNLNFTFITDSRSSKIDFSVFCGPVIQALKSLGVTAELSGRNDMTIGGKKFSGNAMYQTADRTLCHGTLMFDSNLEMLSGALKASKQRFKGVKSTPSAVTNIKPWMKGDFTIGEFLAALKEFMFKTYALTEYCLTPPQLARVDKLRADVYSTRDWNYGASPSYKIHRESYITGCGKLDILMDIRLSRIKNIRIYGDFFGMGDVRDIENLLKNRRLENPELLKVLENIDINSYFKGLSAKELAGLLTGTAEAV